MKKILLSVALFIFLGVVPPAWAAFEGAGGRVPSPTPSSIESVFGQIIPPSPVQALGPGSVGISNVLNKIIQLIYVVASIAFVIMVIVSAFQWIISGGDKEAVAGARKRLTWAIIGITVLALAFVLIKIVGQITGFELFAGQNINPSP